MEDTKSSNGCGYTWGTALALLGGAAVGYWAGRSNGPGCGGFGGFGGGGYGNYGVGCGNAVGAGFAYDNGLMNGKLQNIIDEQASQDRMHDTTAIIKEVTGHGAAILAQVNQLSRDNAALALQNLTQDSNNFRNLDNQLCGLGREMVNQAMATRSDIAAFRAEYNRDRTEDYKSRWMAAENKISNFPIELSLANLTQKVNCMDTAFTGQAVRSVPACPTSYDYYSPCGCGVR